MPARADVDEIRLGVGPERSLINSADRFGVCRQLWSNLHSRGGNLNGVAAAKRAGKEVRIGGVANVPSGGMRALN